MAAHRTLAPSRATDWPSSTSHIPYNHQSTCGEGLLEGLAENVDLDNDQKREGQEVSAAYSPAAYALPLPRVSLCRPIPSQTEQKSHAQETALPFHSLIETNPHHARAFRPGRFAGCEWRPLKTGTC